MGEPSLDPGGEGAGMTAGNSEYGSMSWAVGKTSLDLSRQAAGMTAGSSEYGSVSRAVERASVDPSGKATAMSETDSAGQSTGGTVTESGLQLRFDRQLRIEAELVLETGLRAPSERLEISLSVASGEVASDHWPDAPFPSDFWSVPEKGLSPCNDTFSREYWIHSSQIGGRNCSRGVSCLRVFGRIGSNTSLAALATLDTNRLYHVLGTGGLQEVVRPTRMQKSALSAIL